MKLYQNQQIDDDDEDDDDRDDKVRGIISNPIKLYFRIIIQQKRKTYKHDIKDMIKRSEVIMPLTKGVGQWFSLIGG